MRLHWQLKKSNQTISGDYKTVKSVSLNLPLPCSPGLTVTSRAHSRVYSTCAQLREREVVIVH